jgi:drug/metabolite transporter (DMT)-like permease
VGVTFVQVKDAVAIYPLFAFLALRFAIAGFTLAGDRLGAAGWFGCVVIMAGIVIAEPAAADVLVRLVRRPTGA